MEKRLLIPILAAIAGSSFAQSPVPASSVSSAPNKRIVGNLSLTSAQARALINADGKVQHDPKVQAAAQKLHEARKAVNDLLVARDKSLAPILDKVEAASSPGAVHTPLTDDERQQLRAAREAIKGAPQFAAWQKATEDYQAAVRQAMTADAPSVSPILGKIAHGTVAASPSPSARASP